MQIFVLRRSISEYQSACMPAKSAVEYPVPLVSILDFSIFWKLAALRHGHRRGGQGREQRESEGENKAE